jgi:hypothetical protein
VDIAIDQDHTVDFEAPAAWLESWPRTEFVTFRAIDPTNSRAEDLVQITVVPVNDPPQIAGVPDLFVRYDTPYTFDLGPYVSDIDDLPTDLAVSTTDPAHIQVASPENLVLTMDFPGTLNGTTQEVTLTVSDGAAISAQAINVSVTDTWPPGLRPNRTIPNEAFQEDNAARAFGGTPISDFFTDASADDMYVVRGNGSVQVGIDPLNHLVDLAAEPDWFGEERVTFRAVDPTGALAEYTITVTVLPVNDAPLIAVIPEITVTSGEIRILDLETFITDVDDEFETLEIQTVAGDTQAMTLAGGNLILNYGDGVAEDQIRLLVSDGNATALREFDVRIVEDGEAVVGPLTVPLLLLALALIGILLALAFQRRRGSMDIEEALLIDSSGMLLARAATAESQLMLDDDLFSSMLTALQGFAQDSLQDVTEGSLKRVEYANRKILLERGDTILLAVVYSGSEKKDKLDLVSRTVREVETRYGKVLRNWDGRMDQLSGLPEHLEPLISNERSGRGGGQ